LTLIILNPAAGYRPATADYLAIHGPPFRGAPQAMQAHYLESRMMRSRFALTALLLLGLAAAVCAAGDAVTASPPTQADVKTENSQQSKMATCNTQAAGKTGDDRKAFMKDCLSSKPAAPPTTKLGQCSHDAKAKGLSGADRRSYMSSCMKGS
jgi:psiF repeat-containing protein